MSNMRRAHRMCAGCPFRARIPVAEKIELARLEPHEFPCHEEEWRLNFVQCRGHWQVRRKHGSAGIQIEGKGKT